MTEDVPHIDYWTDLHIEIYCMINQDYYSKHYPYNYEFNHDLPPEQWKKISNPEYDPDIQPDGWPNWCTQKLGIDCLKCVYCGYCEYDEEEE